jgi:hypothetical protein
MIRGKSKSRLGAVAIVMDAGSIIDLHGKETDSTITLPLPTNI